MPKRYVTESEVAENCQVSVRTVRRLISAGTLTAYRIGPCLIRLDADEVERVMLANPVGAP
jgi:excisionase family DNA binding protein